ncbi:PREDICTED: uncharacterized protein LOC109125528 [Camelina sativa]|uniref:Uncharacterized protein LOC109125528 n=1 Tax=Camelina sativa TaxID=90675 RepID=A0ABM1Q7R1_CAMSA|nr:PREDICTED: uncharacterized protein LOC109125528 [Camelina sativa]
MDGGLGTMLMKVALFALVQALVYLILSKSSNVFSRSNSLKRAYSFRPMRSVSIRQILTALQDMPAGEEMSPSSSSSLTSSSQDDGAVTTNISPS